MQLDVELYAQVSASVEAEFHAALTGELTASKPSYPYSIRPRCLRQENKQIA
jgi:hypothetical protein